MAGINHTPAPLVSGNSSYQTSPGAQNATHQVWYENFNDTQLNTLIGKGLSGNLTIAQAMARLDAASAQAGVSRAALYPSVDLEAGASKQWEGGNSEDFVKTAGAALAWEVDIFGRLRAAAQSDTLEAVAAGDDADAVRLAITSDIAVAYYNAVAAQRTLDLLGKQQNGDQELLSLIKLREQEGISTQVEVLQQQSQLTLSQSLIPVAEAELRAQENRLDVLMGTMPDGADMTTRASVFPPAALTPPLGVPSDLLLNRPDLRAEKNRLIAADADIAAAIADRLPRITLTGSYALAAGGGASPVIGLLGALVQPLLDWGQREAEVSRNKALYSEQLAAFSQLYLEAVEDVETTLYQIGKQKEYLARLSERQSILSSSLEKTRAVYKEGLSDYLPVLDALRTLREVERSLVNEQRNLALLHIQLYRALGGNTLPPEAQKDTRR